MITDAELDGIVRKHVKAARSMAKHDIPWCYRCGAIWPCLVLRLAEELRRLRPKA